MDAQDERDGMGWMMGTRSLSETEAPRINSIPFLPVLPGRLRPWFHPQSGAFSSHYANAT